MTLGDLQQRMTPEELLLWSSFYEYRTQEEKKAQDKAMKRRR